MPPKRRAKGGKKAGANAKTRPTKQIDPAPEPSESERALRDAKRRSNDSFLEALVDALVENLFEHKEYEVLKLLWGLCTTTQQAVGRGTPKLVFRTKRQDGESRLGERTMSRFPCVRHIIAWGGSRHISLEGAPSMLRSFGVKPCTPGAAMKSLKVLTLCSSIQSLNLEGCETLATIHNLEGCKNLQELNLKSCYKLQPATLDSLRFLSGLKELQLDYPASQSSFDSSAFAHLDQSCNLSISFKGSKVLNDISHLSECQALRHLRMIACDALFTEAFKALETCTSLRTLMLCDVHMAELPNFGACVNLEAIQLSHCGKLISIAELATAPALKKIQINGWYFSSDGAAVSRAFEPIALCGALEKLELAGIPFLPGLPDLGDCPKLETVSLQLCYHITSITGLPRAMKRFNICGDHMPAGSFLQLSAYPGIESMTLSACCLLHTFPNLSACTNLVELRIVCCPSLKRLSHIGVLTSLKELTISGCDQLNEGQLQALESCTGLVRMVLSKMVGLRKMPDLHTCTKLQDIRLSKNINLKDISSLAECPALTTLFVEECECLPESAVQELKASKGLWAPRSATSRSEALGDDMTEAVGQVVSFIPYINSLIQAFGGAGVL